MLLNFVPKLWIMQCSIWETVTSQGGAVLKVEKTAPVLAAIPMLYIGHIFNKKVIYIESFAKISSPTMTGNLVYKHKLADRFYVQWESMLEFYPNAVYKGGIY